MKIFDVKWQVNTAGPTAPRYKNYRTELFLFGCQRAKDGNPCKGCFNSPIWDDSCVEKTYTPKEVADQILAHAPNKYITIGGGEPTDQFEELIELCSYLKDYGFHIMVYTWKDLMNIFKTDKQEYVLFRRLMRNVDIIVDGEYDHTQRLYREDLGDGFLNSIGSGNQTVWYKSHSNMFTGYKMCNINSLSLDIDNNINIDIKNPLEEYLMLF